MINDKQINYELLAHGYWESQNAFDFNTFKIYDLVFFGKGDVGVWMWTKVMMIKMDLVFFWL
jgi:hypothetical protein